jgi:hypothetical protein
LARIKNTMDTPFTKSANQHDSHAANIDPRNSPLKHTLAAGAKAAADAARVARTVNFMVIFGSTFLQRSVCVCLRGSAGVGRTVSHWIRCTRCTEKDTCTVDIPLTSVGTVEARGSRNCELGFYLFCFEIVYRLCFYRE